MKNIILFLSVIFVLISMPLNNLFPKNNNIKALREVVWLEQEWEIDHWRTYFKEISYYDEEDKLVLEVAQILSNDIWIDSRKTIYYYSDDKQLMKKETYSYSDKDWELTDSIIYKYNLRGKMIENIQRLKIEDSWSDYLKYNFFYDENDNDTLEIKWKNIDNKWEYFYKIEKIWKNNKKVQTILYMIYDNDWLQKTKNIYTYNSLDLLDNILTYAWINYDWMYSSRVLYLYDEKNRLIEQIYQLPTDTGWENQQSYATIYDAEGNEAVLITFQWRNGKKEGFQRSIRESYLSVDDFKPKNNNISIEIYPNPTKNYTNILLEGIRGNVKINIFNILGTIVYTEYKIIDDDNIFINNLNVSILENGFYFIDIENMESHFVKPLIIFK